MLGFTWASFSIHVSFCLSLLELPHGCFFCCISCDARAHTHTATLSLCSCSLPAICSICVFFFSFSNWSSYVMRCGSIMLDRFRDGGAVFKEEDTALQPSSRLVSLCFVQHFSLQGCIRFTLRVNKMLAA